MTSGGRCSGSPTGNGKASEEGVNARNGRPTSDVAQVPSTRKQGAPSGDLGISRHDREVNGVGSHEAEVERPPNTLDARPNADVA
jgi:hypothetical protein